MYGLVPGMVPDMGTSTDTSTGTVPDMKQLLVLRILALVQVSVCSSMGNRREPGQNRAMILVRCRYLFYWYHPLIGTVHNMGTVLVCNGNYACLYCYSAGASNRDTYSITVQVSEQVPVLVLY